MLGLGLESGLVSESRLGVELELGLGLGLGPSPDDIVTLGSVGGTLEYRCLRGLGMRCSEIPHIRLNALYPGHMKDLAAQLHAEKDAHTRLKGRAKDSRLTQIRVMLRHRPGGGVAGSVHVATPGSVHSSSQT